MMRTTVMIVYYLLQFYAWVLFARVVLSWFRFNPYGALGRITSFLYRITEPVLRVIRRVVPFVRAGGGFLDLSPIIAFLIIQVVLWVLRFYVIRNL